MAQIYRSRTSGEYGLYDDQGRFSWVDRDTARNVIETGVGFAKDGDEMTDDDPLWDSLIQITNFDQ